VGGGQRGQNGGVRRGKKVRGGKLIKKTLEKKKGHVRGKANQGIEGWHVEELRQQLGLKKRGGEISPPTREIKKGGGKVYIGDCSGHQGGKNPEHKRRGGIITRTGIQAQKRKKIETVRTVRSRKNRGRVSPSSGLNCEDAIKNPSAKK